MMVLHLLARVPPNNEPEEGFSEDSYHMHVKFNFIKICKLQPSYDLLETCH